MVEPRGTTPLKPWALVPTADGGADRLRPQAPRPAAQVASRRCSLLVAATAACRAAHLQRTRSPRGGERCVRRCVRARHTAATTRAATALARGRHCAGAPADSNTSAGQLLAWHPRGHASSHAGCCVCFLHLFRPLHCATSAASLPAACTSSYMDTVWKLARRSAMMRRLIRGAGVEFTSLTGRGAPTII